jgi:hypothetical protein
MADGKPDLSGVWKGPGAGSYDRNVTRDLKPSDIRPWAEELYQQRVRDLGKDAPRANCLPDPFPYYHMVDLARFAQTPGLIVILYQGTTNSVHRTVFTDGRPLPQDPTPSWQGYSSGKWAGDTLVIDTIGVRDDTWIDWNGGVVTEQAKIREEMRRPDFGRLEIRVTVDDPKAYTKPWTVTLKQRIVVDTELVDEICLENEKSFKHLE